jgi:hypothetical protein
MTTYAEGLAMLNPFFLRYESQRFMTYFLTSEKNSFKIMFSIQQGLFSAMMIRL